MVILDGRFVYADYEQTNVIRDFPLAPMGDCISYLSGRRTFVYDTGILGEVKIPEVKKKMTLSQLYAEKGVGAKFRLPDEPYVYEIIGGGKNYKKWVIILDVWKNGLSVTATTNDGSWHVEPL